MPPKTPIAQAAGAPVVALGRVCMLGNRIGKAAIARYGDLPMWFHESHRPTALFTRHPEMSGMTPEAAEVMAAIGTVATQFESALVALYGSRPPKQRFGFHLDATFEQVAASFAEDGFVIRPVPFD